MLLSWYDRDRDFEAPQHVSECHEKGATPGYVGCAWLRVLDFLMTSVSTIKSKIPGAQPGGLA